MEEQETELPGQELGENYGQDILFNNHGDLPFGAEYIYTGVDPHGQGVLGNKGLYKRCGVQGIKACGVYGDVYTNRFQ